MQTDETRDRQAALERLMAQYGTALLRYYQEMKVNDCSPGAADNAQWGEASAQAGQ